MPTMKPVRLPDELAEAVEALSKERGMTFSALVREALRGYLDEAKRQEKAEQLEARLAASMGRVRKDVRTTRGDVHVVLAYLDCLIRSFLMHTPPVPPEAIKAAAAAADPRYARFMDNVAKSLQGETGLFDRLSEFADDGPAVGALAPTEGED